MSLIDQDWIEPICGSSSRALRYTYNGPFLWPINATIAGELALIKMFLRGKRGREEIN